MPILNVKAWTLSLLLFSPATFAATQCPFIRPPGLSPAQVDSVVSTEFAQFLKKPASGLDSSKTIEGLDGTDNAIMTYSFGTLAVSQTLGFDAAKVFFDAAEARGAKHPYDSLPLADLQSSARAAYAKGRDAPPPVADSSLDYAVYGQPVHAPASSEKDWRLIQCGANAVTFQRRVVQGVATASLRNASVRSYASDTEFLKLVASNLQGLSPSGFRSQPWQPTIVKGTSTPCVDVAMYGNNAASGEGWSLRGRVCYAKIDAPRVYMTLFSEVFASGASANTAQADNFIATTSPR